MEKDTENQLKTFVDPNFKIQFWEHFSKRLLLERELFKLELSDQLGGLPSIRKNNILRNRVRAEYTLAQLDSIKTHFEGIDARVREAHSVVDLWSLYKIRAVRGFKQTSSGMPVLPRPSDCWVFRFPFSLRLCFSDSFSSYDMKYDVFVSNRKEFDGLKEKSQFIAPSDEGQGLYEVVSIL